MSADRTRWFRRRALLTVECLLAAVVVAGVVVPDRDGDRDGHEDAQLTVLTQNLYVGTGVGEVFAASSEAELVAAGSRAWATQLASDFPTRAGALADVIAQAHPDVVGLQEVTLWRDQTPGCSTTRGRRCGRPTPGGRAARPAAR
jgi:hypothetical protein